MDCILQALRAAGCVGVDSSEGGFLHRDAVLGSGRFESFGLLWGEAECHGHGEMVSEWYLVWKGRLEPILQCFEVCLSPGTLAVN